MTALTTDLALLWSACDAAPLDDGCKLALADALAESGDESTERAVRWAAARGRWPCSHNSDWPWRWGPCGAPDSHNTIPDCLFWWIARKRGPAWECVHIYNPTVARTTAELLWRLGQALAAHPEEL